MKPVQMALMMMMKKRILCKVPSLADWFANSNFLMSKQST